MYKLPIEKSRHDYYSTQVNMVPELCRLIKDFQNNIKNVLEFESEPHITVLYGIKNLEDRDNIKQKGMSGKLGKIKKFSQEDKDILVIEIESEDLKRKNQEIRDNIDVNITYPDYTPHLTLAYVKPNSNDDLIGNDYFVGYEFKNLPIYFCGKLEKKYLLEE
jgi:hypothetical protein